jgi:transcriptional regulator with XRE-family HTH domain
VPAAPEPDADILRVRRRVGDRIRVLRGERELTQEQVAERSGLDRKTISRTENAHYPAPLDHLAMIARALGVPVRELFAE